MSTLKELFETMDSRIKGPIIGSVVVSFVLLNWKAFYFLIFSKEAVGEKFNYVDENIVWPGDFVVPIVVGILFAFVSPYIKVAGVFINQVPSRLLKYIHLNSEIKIRNKELELEEANSELQAKKETTVIEQAQRDEQIAQIEDDEARLKAEKEIKHLRSNRPEVLIVSDSELFKTRLETTFVDAKIVPTSANSHNKTLSALSTIPSIRKVLIVSDSNQIDSVLLVTEIRTTNSNFANIPIYVLISEANNQIIKRLNEAGVTKVFVFPLSYDLLVNELIK